MHYQISGPDIVHESFGDDLVVLNLASGQYFGLNQSGACIWHAILRGQSLADCIGNAELASKAQAFAKQLENLGLIAPIENPGQATSEIITLDSAPTIEVYDDLSDLIKADPIHDVDAESGWPVLPDTAT